MNPADQPAPARPGSYALWLVLGQPERLRIGRLGLFDFPAGDYLYLGSAHGPGGLRGRLLHHLRPVARPHWHIDWLREAAVLAGGWYAEGPGALECAWSQSLAVLAAAPAFGFGAADCTRGCPAHLYHLPGDVQRSQIAAILSQSLPVDGLLHAL